MRSPHALATASLRDERSHGDMTTQTSRRAASHALSLGLLAALGLGLTACNGATTGVARYEAVAGDDYRQRHPIRVAPAPLHLAIEVHAGARGITPAQAASVRAFARGYESDGQGPMVLAVPVGTANAVALEHAAASVVATLNQAGIAYVDVQHVHAPHGAAGLSLSYQAVGARVDNCGLWPADAPLTGTEDNRSYHNFGCATQRNLAAQVANPQDLVRPRAPGPSYAARRYGVLKKHAAGEDTTTAYKAENEAAASEVGN